MSDHREKTPYRTPFDEYIHSTIAGRPGVTEVEIVVELGEILGQQKIHYQNFHDAERAVEPCVADAVKHLVAATLVSKRVLPHRIDLFSNGGDPDGGRCGLVHLLREVGEAS